LACYIGAVFFLALPPVVTFIGASLSPPGTAQAGGWFGLPFFFCCWPLGLYLGFRGDRLAREQRSTKPE
jgi:hypothetical protein